MREAQKTLVTSRPRSEKIRKGLGAWYTPLSMVRPLVRWAVRSPSDHLLDPAVGDGAFLAEAARFLRQRSKARVGCQLHGVDINPEAVTVSKAAITAVLGRSDSPDLRVVDFFRVEPPPTCLVT